MLHVYLRRHGSEMTDAVLLYIFMPDKQAKPKDAYRKCNLKKFLRAKKRTLQRYYNFLKSARAFQF